MSKLADILLKSTDDKKEDVSDEVATYIKDIDAEIYNIGIARRDLSKLRGLAEEGHTAVIADRGDVDGLNHATLMLSAHTFKVIIRNVILGERARHSEREPASTMLEGLKPTSPRLNELGIDQLPGDTPGIGADHINIHGMTAEVTK